MSNTLRDAHWQTASLMAMWCASTHKEAAQEGLRAALAGARKRKQELALKADLRAGEPGYQELLQVLDNTLSSIDQAETNAALTISVSFPTTMITMPWFLGMFWSISTAVYIHESYAVQHILRQEQTSYGPGAVQCTNCFALHDCVTWLSGAVRS